MEELFMKLLGAAAAGFVIALLLAILWVAIWTVAVPGAFPGQGWDGHGALTVPIFLFGWLIATGTGMYASIRS